MKGSEGKLMGVKNGWVKGVNGERCGFKVDKREEINVERGRGKGGGK